MTAADDRPIILIAPRLEQPKPCLQMPERLAPEETGSTVFLNAILAAGGLPLIMALTEDEDVIARYVEMADGVAIPGGQDVDPALWGEEDPYDERLLCHERDSFELKLIRAALKAHKPLFATCRGMQILNVALGGTLCMDVPSLPVPEGKVHWRHLPILNDPAHPIAVEDGSLLARGRGNRRRSRGHRGGGRAFLHGCAVASRVHLGIHTHRLQALVRFCAGGAWRAVSWVAAGGKMRLRASIRRAKKAG